ncbi:hypothetical protein DICVIV_13388 [Dictyocaulus viviparus]|uniref:Uncharacterized protein n=1 Tax=Dictyocaulus viviparus TaxID=29172 RepID=A0A0D8X7X1_DICVI|nr:hypothetical protein DICVIV_13388 [Dictyocaulus viviparus]
MTPSVWCRRCDTSDYDFAYTECGADGSRWRVALPYHPGACEGLPEPKKGLNCCNLTKSNLYQSLFFDKFSHPTPCQPYCPTITFDAEMGNKLVPMNKTLAVINPYGNASDLLMNF